MFSILLATYNGEKYIEKSIDSILNQQFPYWELLIGFNGTTDKTKEIVLNYKDSRIKTYDYKNEKGKGKTLNKLLYEASYEWVAIQDDDDIWQPNKLQRQSTYIDRYDVIGSFIYYINEDGQVINNLDLEIVDKKIKHLSLSGNNQIANSSAVIKKSRILDINGWREDIDGIEDYDLWLRLIKNNCLFVNINEYLVMHRLHKKSNFNTKTHDLSLIL